MKDLTEYLSPPQVKSKPILEVINEKSAVDVDMLKDKSVNSSDSIMDSNKLASKSVTLGIGDTKSQQKENNLNPLKSKTPKRNRLDKFKYKSPDLTVTNISTLMSHRLSLVSPEKIIVIDDNKSSNTVNSSYSEDKGLKSSHAKHESEIQLKDSENMSIEDCKEKNYVVQEVLPAINTNEETVGSMPSKMNAFQFMMDSRNKSIGQNLDGKEMDKTEISPTTCREKLAARKTEFQNWANSKGALKRKLEDAEKEIYINKALDRRAKRLKKMLTDEQQPVEAKKRKKVDSDSENSRESENSQKQNEKEVPFKIKMFSPKILNKRKSKIGSNEAKEVSTKVTSVNMQEKKDVKEIEKETKSNKTGRRKKLKLLSDSENSNQDQISKSVADENHSETVKSTTLDDSLDIISSEQKMQKSQNGLLNFLGILNETEEKVQGNEIKTKMRKEEEKTVQQRKSKLGGKSKSLEKQDSQANDEEMKEIKPVINSDAENSRESVKIPRKKLKLLSDTENSNQDTISKSVKDENGSEHVKSKTLDDSSDIISSEQKIRKSQNGLLNFLGILNETEEKVQGNEIKTKMRKGKEKRKSKLRGKSKSLEKQDSQANDEKMKEIKPVVRSDDENSRESVKSRVSSKSLSTEEDFRDIVPVRKSKRAVICEDSESSCSQSASKSQNGLLKENLNSSVFEEEKKSMKSAKKLKEKRKSKRKTKVQEEVNVAARFQADQQLNPLELTPRSLRDYRIRIRIKLADGAESCSIISGDESAEIPTEVRRSSRTIKSLLKKESCDVLLLSDDDSEQINDKAKKTKLAPIFTKSAPKPKLDPLVLEARRNFLYSGVPTSLKKKIETAQSLDEVEFDVFPSISHVLQKMETTKEGTNFWNLPRPTLDLKALESSPPQLGLLQSGSVTQALLKSAPAIIVKQLEKVTNITERILEIKSQYPDYPVYKSYKTLCEISGYKAPSKQDQKAKKRGRKRKKPEEHTCEATDANMWTQKYKPQSSRDFIGNKNSVAQLHKWLASWISYSAEFSKKKSKRKMAYSSSSEFDTTSECDSVSSSSCPSNAVILTGPHGSGKSVAAYAVAHELGLNVIELNASSKRTGKRILQDLQEATQSHQVQKKKSMSTFVQSDSSAKDTDESRKMCLLLIEDVDIVFEQDEGFISALSLLLVTSKRPIVLVTTEPYCAHLQRFVAQYPLITFSALSARTLGIWLQILCLLEGMCVDKDCLGELLEWNKGDVRKTLLQLQFWAQSGGNCGENTKKSSFVSQSKKRLSLEEVLEADDANASLELKQESKDAKCNVTHMNCMQHFMDGSRIVPYPVNLGIVWWNLPNVLNVPTETSLEDVQSNRKKLRMFSEMYDALAQTDGVYARLGLDRELEPVRKSWQKTTKDSLELKGGLEVYTGDKELCQHWTHELVEGHLRLNRGAQARDVCINMAVPVCQDRSWRAKRLTCDELFSDVIPLSSYADRRASSLDYFPVLRSMARSETTRAQTNNKRTNRFYNYLNTLGIRCSERELTTACGVFKVQN